MKVTARAASDDVQLVDWQGVSNRNAAALVGVVCLAAMLAMASAVSAQTPPSGPDDVVERVERLSADGAAFYSSGDYPAALEKFKAAFELEAVTNLLYNIARTYDRMGDSQAAREYYARFLERTDANPAGVAKAKARLAELDEAARRAAAQREVAPVPAMPTDPQSVSAAVETGAGLSAIETSGWVVASLGVAALAAGAGLAIASDGEQTKFDDSVTVSGKRHHRGQAEDYALAGDVTLGIGAALAATGLTLLIVEWTTDSPVGAAESNWRAGPSWGRAEGGGTQLGLSISGAF